MDIRNIQFLLNIIGVDNLLCISNLNDHISHELDMGKSPSTLSSRHISYSRYVQYLKTYRLDF